MKKSYHRFDLFRYQLLPLDRFLQGDLFDDIKSVDELIEHKNEILAEILDDLGTILGVKTYIRARPLGVSGDFYLFRFAVNRSIIRETKDFTEEELDNWPSFLVGFWNHPEKQILLIEERREAFKHTDTVANVMLKSISPRLKLRQLNMFIEPLFKEEAFWNLIDKYEGKVYDVKFEIITPNMANISGVLNDDLKNLARSTNTSRTQIALQSSPDSSLNISKEDKELEGLVKYSSEGGGTVSLKARGVKRRIQTSKTKKSIEIDELEIQGNTADEIVRILKGLVE
jgi:hypothetical protein